MTRTNWTGGIDRGQNSLPTAFPGLALTRKTLRWTIKLDSSMTKLVYKNLGSLGYLAALVSRRAVGSLGKHLEIGLVREETISLFAGKLSH